MSDTSQGPGWWIASDGRWYPPEQHPDAIAPAAPSTPPGRAGEHVLPGAGQETGDTARADATTEAVGAGTGPAIAGPPAGAGVVSGSGSGSPDATTTHGGTRRRAPLLVGLAALVLVALTAGVLVVRRGDDGPAAPTETVALEPIAFPGDDPFADATGVQAVAAFPAQVVEVIDTRQSALPVDAATGTRSATGAEPGLYGGTQDQHVCDPGLLVSYLAAHADKAAAWAAVQGITPAGIADFVATLTPVVLTTDTRVTNHGFAAGAATAFQTVLQAGTAVLVDRTGAPRTRCACGNPLTQPTPTAMGRATTTGTPWPSYRADAVTTITPGPMVTQLTILDLRTAQLYLAPTGTDLGLFGSGPLAPPDRGGTTTTPPATSARPTTTSTTTAPPVASAPTTASFPRESTTPRTVPPTTAGTSATSSPLAVARALFAGFADPGAGPTACSDLPRMVGCPVTDELRNALVQSVVGVLGGQTTYVADPICRCQNNGVPLTFVDGVSPPGPLQGAPGIAVVAVRIAFEPATTVFVVAQQQPDGAWLAVDTYTGTEPSAPGDYSTRLTGAPVGG